MSGRIVQRLSGDTEIEFVPLLMMTLDFSWCPLKGRLSGFETTPEFHEARWKLFFLRTLALYAARIAVADSLIMLAMLLLEWALWDMEVSDRAAIDNVETVRGSDGKTGDDNGEGEIFRTDGASSLRCLDAEDDGLESSVDKLSTSD